MAEPLIQVTADGLYCVPGGFHVDPWRPVERAVVTHGHSDHLCRGCKSYLVAQPGELVARARLGPEGNIDTLPYGHDLEHNGVRITLLPAGHLLGSAQVPIQVLEF